jgi:hypothetical protein
VDHVFIATPRSRFAYINEMKCRVCDFETTDWRRHRRSCPGSREKAAEIAVAREVVSAAWRTYRAINAENDHVPSPEGDRAADRVAAKTTALETLLKECGMPAEGDF